MPKGLETQIENARSKLEIEAVTLCCMLSLMCSIRVYIKYTSLTSIIVFLLTLLLPLTNSLLLTLTMHLLISNFKQVFAC